MGMSAVLRRTWRRAWEGRFSSAALILFVPLFFSTLFGFVYYQNVVKHVPLLILDEDQSSSSRAFAQMFADADAFDVVGYAGTEEELSARVQSGEVVAGLGIPADFSKKLKQGGGFAYPHVQWGRGAKSAVQPRHIEGGHCAHRLSHPNRRPHPQ